MIARNLMPQIKAEHIPLFLKTLQRDGIHVTHTVIAARNLVPMQALNPSKVAAMKDNPRSLDKEVIVSRDNKIVDGHHRYGVGLETGKPVKIARINLSFDDIFTKMHAFEHTFTKEFHEDSKPEEPDAEKDSQNNIKLSGKKDKIEFDLDYDDLYVDVNEAVGREAVEVIPKERLPEAKDSADAEKIFRQMYMRAKGERNEDRRKAWLGLAKKYLTDAINLHFDETSPDDGEDDKQAEKSTDKNESTRPHWNMYK